MTADRILGIDLSPNHGAFVALGIGGLLVDYCYATDRRKVADKSKSKGTYLALTKYKGKENAQVRSMVRMEFWDGYLEATIGDLFPSHVGLEDYAYRAAQGAHQIGEVGGIARSMIWRMALKARLHDPQSAKMFVAHKGNADKTMVANAVRSRWPETEEFDRYTVGSDSRTTEDLFDAYAIARLVLTELLLRRGELDLSSLHEKEIQVFNRCTKNFPVSTLGRSWIQKGNE